MSVKLSHQKIGIRWTGTLYLYYNWVAEILKKIKATRSKASG